MNKTNNKNIFLLGPPNCGKTTLFNWLTGFKNKIINYPGSTVSISTGHLLKKYNYNAMVIDSPGTYSLTPLFEDEIVSLKALSKDKDKQIVVLVLDTSKLEIQLPLYFKLKEQGYQLILALTMNDILSKSELPQAQNLSRILKNPVVAIQGLTGYGVVDLVYQIKNYKPLNSVFNLNKQLKESKLTLLNYCKNTVQKSLNNSQQKVSISQFSKEKIFRSKKWDRFFLHPKFGFLFFVGIMFTLFSSIFWLATPFMDIVDFSFSFLIDQSMQTLSHYPQLADFVSNGLIAGFGAVLVFVPQIFILFIGISLLEDTGYLARAVALMDGPFSKIGLSGRSFVPFLSGYACAIPSILMAKNLSSRREKLMVFFSVPFMSCSARIPVYTLLLSFLFYGQSAWKPAIALTGIYIASFLLGILCVVFLNPFFKKENSESFLLDLPIYRKPSLLKILNRAFRQSQHYVVKAGPPIFFVSLSLWLLTHYPSHPELSDVERVSQSWAAQLGQFVEPVFKLMGLDWRVGFALIAAFAAREIFVSALLLIFMITKGNEEALMSSLLQNMQTSVHSDGLLIFTGASVASLIVFFMISLQCLSTSALIYKESGSLKLAVIQFLTLNFIAYVLAVITYQSLSFIL